MLATQTRDDTIRLYESVTGKSIRLVRKGTTSDWLSYDGSQVVFTRDGHHLASGGADHTVRLWECNTGREVLRISLGALDASGLAVSPNDHTLAAACTRHGYYDSIHTWSLPSGKELQEWKVEEAHWLYLPSGPLAYSPNGSILALAYADHIHLWDAASGRLLRRLSASAVNSLAFSPDGRVLASGAGRLHVYLSDFGNPRNRFSAVVQLWDVETGKELLKIDGVSEERIKSKAITGIINCVAFAPDGQLLATASDDGSVRLWEAATGKEILRFKDKAAEGPSAYCVAFSPDGKRLVSGFGGALIPQEFALPNGKKVTSGLTDGTAIVWEVAPPGWTASAAKNLRDADLQALWADLAGDDATQAYRAVWTLSAAPAEAVGFFQSHLHPVPHEDDNKLAELIADLDNDDFAVSEAVTRELIWLGPQVEPALRRTLANNPSPEARGRIEGVLPAHHSWGILPALENLAGPRDAATLCSVRAICVLQRIGTPGARALLEKLATGDPQARPTREAQAALARLSKKPRPR